MNLPNLSQPVQRSGNTKFASDGITPSDPAGCSICCAAAGALPWPASAAAKAACGLGGCHC